MRVTVHGRHGWLNGRRLVVAWQLDGKCVGVAIARTVLDDWQVAELRRNGVRPSESVTDVELSHYLEL